MTGAATTTTAPEEAQAEAADRRSRLLMLVTLAVAMFFVSATSGSISPFLVDMANELATTVAAIGNLAAFSSITWAISSLSSGTASDRIGRKPVILVGLLILVGSSIGVATAPSYGALIIWRLIGGIGGGAYMGTVFAAVADRFPAAERGRALGWLATGQSLSLVIAVPFLTAVGSVSGWRGASWTYALAILIPTIGVWLFVPRVDGLQTSRSKNPFAGIAKALTARTMLLISAGVGERLCFAGISLFFPSFLLLTYDIPLSLLALSLAPIAAGNFVGNVLGGRLADRFPARSVIFGCALIATGLLAAPALRWHPGLLVSILIGFVYNFLNAIGRPALLTALSEAAPEARGALLGLNITVGSLGWLLASAVGGLLIARTGFGGLGTFTAAISFVGAALAFGSWAVARRET